MYRGIESAFDISDPSFLDEGQYVLLPNPKASDPKKAQKTEDAMLEAFGDKVVIATATDQTFKDYPQFLRDNITSSKDIPVPLGGDGTHDWHIENMALAGLKNASILLPAGDANIIPKSLYARRYLRHPALLGELGPDDIVDWRMGMLQYTNADGQVVLRRINANASFNGVSACAQWLEDPENRKTFRGKRAPLRLANQAVRMHRTALQVEPIIIESEHHAPLSVYDRVLFNSPRIAKVGYAPDMVQTDPTGGIADIAIERYTGRRGQIANARAIGSMAVRLLGSNYQHISEDQTVTFGVSSRDKSPIRLQFSGEALEDGKPITAPSGTVFTYSIARPDKAARVYSKLK